MSKWVYAKSVPEKLFVACSGGVDSIAAAAILNEWRDVTLLHFSHFDHAAEHELTVVTNLAEKLGVQLLTAKQQVIQKAGNNEAQWRDARYQWFHSFDGPVATGHTLDDAVEWYLITCLRGRGEFMPVSNRNVFRPFLTSNKIDLYNYAVKNDLDWFEDQTNHDIDFSLRGKVRKCLVPNALLCEPGLKNVVKRKIMEKRINN